MLFGQFCCSVNCAVRSIMLFGQLCGVPNVLFQPCAIDFATTRVEAVIDLLGNGFTLKALLNCLFLLNLVPPLYYPQLPNYIVTKQSQIDLVTKSSPRLCRSIENKRFESIC